MEEVIPDTGFHLLVAGVIAGFLMSDACPIMYRRETMVPVGNRADHDKPLVLEAVTKSGLRQRITIEALEPVP